MQKNYTFPRSCVPPVTYHHPNSLLFFLSFPYGKWIPSHLANANPTPVKKWDGAGLTKKYKKVLDGFCLYFDSTNLWTYCIYAYYINLQTLANIIAQRKRDWSFGIRPASSSCSMRQNTVLCKMRETTLRKSYHFWEIKSQAAVFERKKR